MKVHIPTPLRQYSHGKETVEVSAMSVEGALEALVLNAPELRKHLFNEEGRLRSFVNVYLNDDDVRYLPAKEATGTDPDDELTIIPSIAGGSPSAAPRCCCPLL